MSSSFTGLGDCLEVASVGSDSSRSLLAGKLLFDEIASFIAIKPL